MNVFEKEFDFKGRKNAPKKVVKVVRANPQGTQRRQDNNRYNSGSDDGMSYNPFAALLKK